MDWVKGRSGESLRAMIERACCSVTTVSGRDRTSASASLPRTSVSKRPRGLSAAPRPLMLTGCLSMSFRSSEGARETGAGRLRSRPLRPATAARSAGRRGQPLHVCRYAAFSRALDGLALPQAGNFRFAVAVGREHGRGVLSQFRPGRIDVTRRVRKLGYDARHLDRRAVLEPDFADHVPGQILRFADDGGHAVDLAVRDLRIVENSHK